MITPVAPVAASALQRRLGDDDEAEQLVTSGPQVWSPVGSRTSRNGFGYGMAHVLYYTVWEYRQMPVLCIILY